MKCPSCLQAIHKGASSCPHCGFSISALDEKVGKTGVQLRRLEDRGGLLRNTERRHIAKLLDQFLARFPQLFFSVVSGRPEEGMEIQPYGFWLLNRAEFVDIGPNRNNDGGILLVIDADAKTAGITWGYLLDSILSEKDSFQALSRAHAYWLEGRYSEGIERVIEHLVFVLVRRSKRAKPDKEPATEKEDVS